MTKHFRNGQYIDPVNVDALPYNAEDASIEHLRRAHRVLPELRGFADRFPDELSEHLAAVERAVEHAEKYEDDRDAAAAEMAVRGRERDNAGRVAIRMERDPESAEKGSQKALDAAKEKAARLERYRAESASNAAATAARATAALDKVKRENADTIMQERVLALETARVEAVEAAQEAARKIRELDVRVLHAQNAGQFDPDSELSPLMKSPFDLDTRRVGSQQLTLNRVLQELDRLPDKLSYRNPGGSRPTALGVGLGKALEYARDQRDQQ